MALEAIRFPKPVIVAGADRSPRRSTRQGRRGARPAGPRRPDVEARTPTRRRRRRSSRGMGELHLEISHREAEAGARHPAGDPADSARQAAGGVPPDASRGRWTSSTSSSKQTGGRGKFAVINVKYKPLTPEEIEEKVTEIEELKDPKVKPDPNNVYFVNAITPGVDPEGVHPARGGRAPRGGEEGVQVPVPVRRSGVRRCTSASTTTWTRRRTRSTCAPWKRFRDAEDQAGITLLEPIMKVVVVSPEAVPGRDLRRHQPPPRHDRGDERGQGHRAGDGEDAAGEPVRLHQRPALRPRPARRASRWSSATTPRSARNWPTCRRRMRQEEVTSGGHDAGLRTPHRHRSVG